MMSFKDKTFCNSPGCNNDCGRKMSEKEKAELDALAWQSPDLGFPVAYSYFCGICDHEYKKILAESGMYFINMCHKCMHSKPSNNEEII